MNKDELTLRKLLWLRHGCDLSALYGDDGELQCHICKIDFLRDAVDYINKRFYEIGLNIYLESIERDWILKK
jgi:hypothetical protein